VHSSSKISNDQFATNEMGGLCSTYGGEERCVEGKIPLGRHRNKLEDNINMDLQEVGYRVGNGSRWFSTGVGGGHL